MSLSLSKEICTEIAEATIAVFNADDVTKAVGILTINDKTVQINKWQPKELEEHKVNLNDLFNAKRKWFKVSLISGIVAIAMLAFSLIAAAICGVVALVGAGFYIYRHIQKNDLLKDFGRQNMLKTQERYHKYKKIINDIEPTEDSIFDFNKKRDMVDRIERYLVRSGQGFKEGTPEKQKFELVNPSFNLWCNNVDRLQKQKTENTIDNNKYNEEMDRYYKQCKLFG